MPSSALLVLLAKLGGLVAVAYCLRLGRWPTPRGIAAFFLFTMGALGCYEGFTLTVREESRLRYGSVVSGVVLEKYRTDGRGHTYATDGRRGPGPGTSGFLLTRAFAHRVAYGSFAIRIVDYRYPCDTGSGTCRGRDYVAPELWGRLVVGEPVNVRQAEGERDSARLDENPQLTLGLAQTAISILLLVGASLLWWGVKLRMRQKYLSAPAVVTAVERVNYRDATRWKVRFAYFDENGVAQESADEVAQPTWKPGDDCIAIYRPETPDLATLQPAT